MANPGKRFIGIDFGTKRIGLARSDPFGMFAQPVGTFDRKRLFGTLERIALAEGIEKIIVGYPLSGSGETNRMTGVVDLFINELRSRFPDLSVETVDEHRSSSRAMGILVEHGQSRKKRQVKGRLDCAAACVILQEYLDSRPQ